MCVIPHASPTDTEASQPKTVVAMRFEVFDALCNARGLDQDLKRARALGISHTTLSRLRSGHTSAGGKVIRRAIELLGVPYAALFEERAA